MPFDIADYKRRTGPIVFDDLDLTHFAEHPPAEPVLRCIGAMQTSSTTRSAIGSDEGRAATQRIDRRVQRLPGLADLRLVETAVVALAA